MVRHVLFVVLCGTSLTTTYSCAAPREITDSSTPQVQMGGGVAGETYRQRYAFTDASQKLVSNTGTGLESLYGLRNFRAVLNGVYYRSGANNVYFQPRRHNSNPIPEQGLQNLCEEGFTRAVYLYSTNYAKSPHRIRCRTFDGHENTLEYLQISPLSYRESDRRELLTMILEHVRNPRLGPILDHCWNGWHASGYVAALALRQYCGFTAQQAIDYWNLNTDGNNGGSSGYDKIRAALRDFEPYADLSLSAQERGAICPQPGSLRFPAR